MRLKADDLSDLRGIEHGFFTREGGVSPGIYNSLNCGFGSSDDRDNVAENRARVSRELGARQPVSTVYQVHSASVQTITEPVDAAAVPQADALVTATPGVPIGILTADCVPVLFADPQANVIGAAHAGWKGALTGILENTIRTMEELGADRSQVIAVAGPAISASAYEVGPEFRERFTGHAPKNAGFFRPSGRDGHAMFDLPSYAIDRLRAFGVKNAQALGECTYEDGERFFSYRRKTHKQEPDYGRQISAILLTGQQ